MQETDLRKVNTVDGLGGDTTVVLRAHTLGG
jgi:hypothetical protein